MNKIVKGIVVVSLIALTLVGCSGDKKSFDSEGFVSTVMEKVTYDDEMIEVPEKTAKTLYSLDFEGLESYKLYTSATSATANELMVIKVKDNKSIEAAKKSIEARKTDLISLYKDYRPEEMQKLDNAIIVTEGDYVIFSVCSSNADVQKYITESVK